ncbi:MAG: zinc-ribbon domain-containing protein [Gemmatimonadales bacterium]|nr:MAG: zinc-ribbon domain-containing protein [Gemmatimonadales bacterium]
MTALIAAISLAGLVVLWILFPLLKGLEAPMSGDDVELNELLHRKKVALLGLRDAEYDFQSGKLEEEDYRALKGSLATEALAAMDEEARLLAQRASTGPEGRAGRRAEIEAEIAELRAELREGKICPSCGLPNARNARYCSDCGTELGRGTPASPTPATG